MQKFESTLHFSKQFFLVQTLIVLLSVGSSLLIAMAVPLKLVVVLCVLRYVAINLCSNNRYRAIGHDENGWYLIEQNRKVYIDFQNGSTITTIVSVIRFKLPQKFLKQSIVFFKDSMPHDSYRKFIVRVKFF